MDEYIVYVDVTDEKVERRLISPEIRKKYIGAIGINAMLLMESNAHLYDSLSDKNVLIFGVSPIVGTGMMAGNRCVVTTKSPITEMYGESNIGGNFPVRMRMKGISNLVIQGKASSPIYILCESNGNIKICDAEDLWGLPTDEVTDILMQRHGAKSEVACIGQAGEKLVRYASVIMAKKHAAGRMGTGCVMGSKNVKAIVMEPAPNKIQYHDKEAFDKVKQSWVDGSRRSAISHMGGRYGTLFLLEANNRSHGLPVRNFQTGHDKEAENLYPVVFLQEYKTKKEACYACPIGCSKRYEVKEGKYKGLSGSRIEFGAASIGPMTGVFDWPGVLHMKLLCDKYGIDTIEAGAVIALAMEGCERGILKKSQLFQREIGFGSVEDAEFIMDIIVNRKGIGDVLAEGVYRASKELGLEKYGYCINRSSTGLQSNGRLVRSLGYITSTRGGDHLKSFAFTMQNGGYYIARHIFGLKNVKKELDKPINIGRILWWHENYKVIVDAIGVCLFAIQGLPSLGIGMFDDYAEILRSMYGIDMTPEEVFDAAERIYQLANVFNVACGLSIDDYVWPERPQDPDIDEEFLSGTILTKEDRDAPGMLPEYFKFRGLTSTGRPTRERLSELGILELCKEFMPHVEDDADVSSMEALRSTVALTIDYSWRDELYVKLSCFIMDRLLSVKDALQIKKLEKEKRKKERTREESRGELKESHTEI